jgi:hypothetical protein
MAAVSEWIAREYFEHLGYLVSQPRKHSIPGRHKKASEELDLIILNPTVQGHRVPDYIAWTSQDFAGVARAVVAVRGWHTERFSVLTFEQTPDILKFVQAESLRLAERLLGGGPMAKVLCLPRLPASGEMKAKTVEFLRDKGIDGVISFQTMLAELIACVEINRNYEKSDLLQIIRLMKNYELLREPQMDLFHGRRRKRGGVRRTAGGAGQPSQAAGGAAAGGESGAGPAAGG